MHTIFIVFPAVAYFKKSQKFVTISKTSMKVSTVELAMQKFPNQEGLKSKSKKEKLYVERAKQKFYF